MFIVAFAKSTISRIRVQSWYNRFKKGQEDVNGDSRSGHPSTLTTDNNVEAVKQIILDSCRMTIRAGANDVGILFGPSKQVLQMF